jgi:MFS family permease
MIDKRITLLLASGLTIMSATTIAPALPQIAKFFSGNAEILSKLVLTIPALFIAVFSPVMGALLSRFGRVKILFFSLVLYAVAGSSGYFVEGIFALLAGRAILGIAVAGIMTATTTLIGDYFTGEARNRFTGMQSMFSALCGVLFVVIGGVLAEYGWHTPFLIYLFSLVVLGFGIFTLTEPEVNASHNLEIENEKTYSKKLVAMIMGTAFITMIVFNMAPVQIPFLLKEISVSSSRLIGVAISCFTLGGAITSGLYGVIKKKLSHSQVNVLAFLLFGIGYMLVGFANSYAQVLICLSISGIGGGMMLPNAMVWLLSATHARDRGMMMGLLSSFIFLGQFVSPIIVQPIIGLVDLSATFVIVGLFALLISGMYAFVSESASLVYKSGSL